MRELRLSGGGEPADEALVRLVAVGDERALDELQRRYGSVLTQYASRLLGNAGAGETVSELALVHAERSLRRGATPVSVRPWLFRITLNAALELRAKYRASAADGELSADDCRLPERQRRAFVLREVYGLRVSEIAAELEVSRLEVEQALFTARNRLAALDRRRERVFEPNLRRPRRSLRERASALILGTRLSAARAGVAGAIAVGVALGMSGAPPVNPGDTPTPVASERARDVPRAPTAAETFRARSLVARLTLVDLAQS